MLDEYHEKINKIVKTLRTPNVVLNGEFLEIVKEHDEKAYKKLIEIFPEELNEKLYSQVHKIITENKIELWKAAFYDALMENIHKVLGNTPIYATATLATEKGNSFIAELLADFLSKEIEEIESKNTTYTLFDYEYKSEMFLIKFMFLEKGTKEELHIDDAVEGESEVKLFVCYASED